ncbi:hypothetical protein [Nonomuraea sp. NPDC048916]|uniref:hypothetical protein n=1 Tax=Nonomuraea sp. NPDC048916 TaxID=3154232 RepID=UPI0033DB186F
MLWGTGIALAALVVAVVVARLLRGIPAVEAFIAEYPGMVAPPGGAPVGLPAWRAWQHFLNAFFLALLVKTGLELRGKRRPPGFWTRDNTRWPRTGHAPRRLAASGSRRSGWPPV